MKRYLIYVNRHFICAILLLVACGLATIGFAQSNVRREVRKVLVAKPLPHQQSMCAYPAMYTYINDSESVFTREQSRQLDSLVADFYVREKIVISIYTTGSPLRFKDFEEFAYSNIKINEFEQHGIDQWIVVSMSKSLNKVQVNRSKTLATVFSDESIRKLTAGCFRPEIDKRNFYDCTLSGMQGLIEFWESNK